MTKQSTFKPKRTYAPMGTPLIERLLMHAERRDGCLVWTGAVAGRGYGHINLGGKYRKTHVVMYELLRGPVPEGKELDHTCLNVRCMDVSHLEPVTHRINVLRGTSPAARQARQTHCKHGHSLSDAYVSGGHRYCRMCTLDTRKRQAQEKKGARHAS